MLVNSLFENSGSNHQIETNIDGVTDAQSIILENSSTCEDVDTEVQPAIDENLENDSFITNAPMNQIIPCTTVTNLVNPTTGITISITFGILKLLFMCLDETNIIVLNFDELTSKYDDATAEVIKLKSENENLQTELSKANRRNKLLQDYLVAVDERVPEILFVEKVRNLMLNQAKTLNK